MKSGANGRASVRIQATPEVLYDMVSDVRRMGEWSPECRHCEWIDGATGPAVGARFKGSNRRGAARWSTKPRVVTADPGQEFTFVTSHLHRDMTRWGYRFERVADGSTTVTESFEMLTGMPWYFRLSDRLLIGVKNRKSDLEENMAETLARLKAAVESTHAFETAPTQTE